MTRYLRAGARAGHKLSDDDKTTQLVPSRALYRGII